MGTPKCLSFPSEAANPWQIFRKLWARPNWQNGMATNWPQQVNPRAWRSPLCCWTAPSNSTRENNCNNWMKILHTRFMVKVSLR